MIVGSLFSGIGGFDLAAQWIGWETKWYSEIDPYACRVMQKHFPRARNVGDITTWEPMADATGQRAEPIQQQRQVRSPEPCSSDAVSLICGGFPCQPVSVAGKQLAQDDPRWLWPHFARVIRALRPRYVVVENVPGLLVRGGLDVLGDFAAIGLTAEWETIPAAAVGAPHRRDRIWIVAYPARDEQRGIRRTRERVVDGGAGIGRLGRQRTDAEEVSGAVPDPDGREQGRREFTERGPHQRNTNTSGNGPQRDMADANEQHGNRGGHGAGQDEQQEQAVIQRGGQDVRDTNESSEDARTAPSGPRTATSEPSSWDAEPDMGQLAHGVSPELAEFVTRTVGIGSSGGRQPAPHEYAFDATRIARVAVGIPERVDRLKCLGNAIVPQVAYWIFQQIEAAERRAA